MSPIKVLIIGSCVSRDIFNYDKEQSFELAAYYARSSFASAFSATPALDRYSANLSSRFQATIVKADLQKSAQVLLPSTQFDVLLIDLIDERFNLFADAQGTVFTVSNELCQAGFDPEKVPGTLIKSASEEHFALWAAGWQAFVDLLNAHGALSKVIVNRTTWSTQTKSGKDFGGGFSLGRIDAANAYLQRLYERMSLDLDATQFIEPPVDLVFGDEDHQWGLSPFHYVDEYYTFFLERLKVCTFSGSGAVSEELDDGEIFAGRLIRSGAFYSNTRPWPHVARLEPRLFRGTATCTRVDDNLHFSFLGNQAYQVRLPLPQPVVGNGLNIRLALSGWASFESLSIGYNENGEFRGLTCLNAKNDVWIDFEFGHGDLIFEIQNNFLKPPLAGISEVKMYVKGVPSAEGASLLIESVAVWKEKSRDATAFDYPETDSRSSELFAAIHESFNQRFPEASTQAMDCLSHGVCPLEGNTGLSWPSTKSLPNGLDDPAHLASWHSLHHATILMLRARTHDDLAALFCARDFVGQWLEHNYFQLAEDGGTVWGAHIVAERTLALLMMWDFGVRHRLDRRFMARLHGCIFKHAQLLSNDVFYIAGRADKAPQSLLAQNIALCAASVVMEHWSGAKDWLAKSLDRSVSLSREEQLSGLFSVSPDSGFSKHTHALVVLLRRLVELSAPVPGPDQQAQVVIN
jgi:hypothetical protein